MLRTILGNKKLMEEVVRECCFADKIYFYWGDKSAMLIPFLKKLVKPNVEIMPMFCARFHGSDLYEEAKGYLPFRDMIMEHTDYAIPVSYNGMNYIKANYNPCPKITFPPWRAADGPDAWKPSLLFARRALRLPLRRPGKDMRNGRILQQNCDGDQYACYHDYYYKKSVHINLYFSSFRLQGLQSKHFFADIAK